MVSTSLDESGKDYEDISQAILSLAYLNESLSELNSTLIDANKEFGGMVLQLSRIESAIKSLINNN